MLRKIPKYRKIICLVLWNYVKHSVIRLVLGKNSKLLFEYYYNKRTRNKISTITSMQPMQRILGQIDKILQIVEPEINCLTESMIKKEVLANYGYEVKVKLSMYRSRSSYKAHAWLLAPKMKNYKTLLKI